MTREDIERKCLEYSQVATPSYTNGTFDRYAIAQAYEEGAKWRINSVWHNKEETPKKGEHIIVRISCGSFTSWFATDDIMKVFEKFGVTIWAYVKDLLPTKEEQL